jgi:hexokinase
MVARRAALLSGVALAAVLIKTGRAVLQGKGSPPKSKETLMVGVDGS